MNFLTQMAARQPGAHDPEEISPRDRRRLVFWLNLFLLSQEPAPAMQAKRKSRGGTPIHYLYGYVPPKGVVRESRTLSKILKALFQASFKFYDQK